MDLIYPINFVGHDEWMASGYALELASGDVITRDGEVLGIWRVVDYNPEADYGNEDGKYEFIADGQQEAMFSQGFAVLESRVLRGLALLDLIHAIRKWHEADSNQGASDAD